MFKDAFHLDKIYQKTINKATKSKYRTSRKKALEKIEKGVERQDLGEYLKQIHKAFKRLNSINPDSRSRQEEYLLEKICEKCSTIVSDDLLLLCDLCDDAYHTFCLVPPLQTLPAEDEDWLCPPCLEQKAKQGMKEKFNQLEEQNMQEACKRKRQSTLDEHFIIKETREKICFGCKEIIKELDCLNNKKLKSTKPSQVKSQEICIKCQNYFHPKCFSLRKNAIICQQCDAKITSTESAILPKCDNTIMDFFKVKLDSNSVNFEDDQKPNNTSTILRLDSPVKTSKVPKVKKKSSKIVYQKKKRKFRLPNLSKGANHKLERKRSLAYALLSKNITFDDDLCFSNPNCPPSCNDALLEPNLQKMNKDNAEIFHKFKEMTRNGDYAPVVVEEDKDQGFLVRADEDIPRLTLLSEYVGEVDFARNRLFDQNDSIMDLLRTPHSSTSLVICPENRGNLARFISGINNFDEKAKLRKQNVKSIRYNIDGHARVFLYADKAIKKGDILYYDYNEGGFNEYPTEEFI